MSVFVPLDHQRTPTAAYLQIRGAILDGSLPPGSQLREAHIATDMGISRSPLREALTRLEEEGLVVKWPFRGAFVATVSAETVAEIATIRVLVEPHVVDLAAQRLAPGDWNTLSGILATFDAATTRKELSGQIDAHLAFHGFFYEHCGNQLLADLWHAWESKLRLFFVADHSAFADPRDVLAVHEELLAVIRSGDRKRIHAALQLHIHEAPGRAATVTPGAS